MRTETHERFNELMASSVKIRECPHCRHVAEIRVVIPMYGRTGARVECPNCGCQTKTCGIITVFFEEGTSRMGSPITPESLLKGVLEAVRLWNGVGGTKDGT